MIITSLSDLFYVSVTNRIRAIFFGYSVVAAVATFLAWFYPSVATDWDYAYSILFPLALVGTLHGLLKPSLGMASIYLFPLMVVSIVRIVDFWQSFIYSQLSVQTVLQATIGWLAIVISITFVDLLESKIYHRLVNEQNTE